MKNWFLITHQHGKFDEIITHLTTIKIEFFAPVIKKTHQCMVKIKNKTYPNPQTRILPVFPGYIFVNIDFFSDERDSILSHKFVFSFVSFSLGQPAMVQPSVIETLKNKEFLETNPLIEIIKASKGKNKTTMMVAFLNSIQNH